MDFVIFILRVLWRMFNLAWCIYSALRVYEKRHLKLFSGYITLAIGWTIMLAKLIFFG